MPVGAVPNGRKVKLVAQICETNHFIFPEGMRPISPVYEPSTTPSLSSFWKEVKISMNRSTEGNHALLRLMTASRVPRWDSKLTPLYEFKPLSGMFEHHSQTGVIFLSQLDCYLAIGIGRGTSKNHHSGITTCMYMCSKCFSRKLSETSHEFSCEFLKVTGTCLWYVTNLLAPI